jgi:hypothetical protein
MTIDNTLDTTLNHVVAHEMPQFLRRRLVQQEDTSHLQSLRPKPVPQRNSYSDASSLLLYKRRLDVSVLFFM